MPAYRSTWPNLRSTQYQTRSASKAPRSTVKGRIRGDDKCGTRTPTLDHWVNTPLSRSRGERGDGTHQTEQRDPRRKHERGKERGDDLGGELLLRTERVGDGGLSVER